MTLSQSPSAGYKVNSFQEIKSHSSILFNERCAILFWQLDNAKVELYTTYDINTMHKVKAILIQLYANFRILISNNPTMRVTLNLETKDEGVYITDVMLETIKKMILYCDQTEYTQKRLYIIVEELNKFDMLMKTILQYYHYFIRPDFRQKPDIEIATEKYKEIADRHTIEELRQIIGKKHQINFESLGSTMIDYSDELNKEDVTEEDKAIGELSLMDEEDKEPEEEKT